MEQHRMTIMILSERSWDVHMMGQRVGKGLRDPVLSERSEIGFTEPCASRGLELPSAPLWGLTWHLGHRSGLGFMISLRVYKLG